MSTSPPVPPTAFAPVPASHPMPVLTGDHDALPAGSRLAEFEILRVIGVGGFGIVYLAMDHALERQVAIKEYMPGALAGRGAGSQISLRSTAHADTFATGLRSFVNEAKLLARFDHPSLVKVYRFWEANNTAYMAMPYYEGITLQAARRSLDRPPGEARLRAVLDPLLGALEVMHGESCYHRDIAPDNIVLLPDGRPVLLDFGAARQVIGDRTQNLTAILKPAFAPIEQYADVTHLKQGPWTDLYAVGAVMHYCLSGQPPMPSAARAVHDELKPAAAVARVLSEAFPGTTYSPGFLQAIDWALAIRPEDRPQSVAEFRDALAGHRRRAPERVQPTAAAAAAPVAAAPPAPAAPQARRGIVGPAMVAVAGVTAVALLTVGVLSFLQREAGEPAAGQATLAAPLATAAAATEAPAAAASAMILPAEAAPAQAAVMTAAVRPEASAPAAPAPAVARPTRPAAQAQPVPRSESRAVAEARPQPAEAPPPVQREAAGPATPREACGRRVLLALWRCMKQVCEKPAYAQHPQCVQLREEEAERARQREY